MVYSTTGDDNNISDGKYSGVLTGNNWTAPGAVFFSHGLYLLFLTEMLLIDLMQLL